MNRNASLHDNMAAVTVQLEELERAGNQLNLAIERRQSLLAPLSAETLEHIDTGPRDGCECGFCKPCPRCAGFGSFLKFPDGADWMEVYCDCPAGKYLRRLNVESWSAKEETKCED